MARASPLKVATPVAAPLPTARTTENAGKGERRHRVLLRDVATRYALRVVATQTASASFPRRSIVVARPHQPGHIVIVTVNVAIEKKKHSHVRRPDMKKTPSEPKKHQILSF